MNYNDQLQQILKYSGWTQEQLAKQLDVSFATLNSWVNQRSTPRVKAQKKIEDLLLGIVGVEAVDPIELLSTKKVALTKKLSAISLAKDAELLDKLTLYLTYHTNTIEGSTMTLSDVEDVLFDNKVLSNRTAVEQAEARNHQATLHWLIDQLNVQGKSFRIDEELINAIHLRLMNGIISDAGQYRKHSVRIMGSRVTLSNWAKIPELIIDLVGKQGGQKPDLILEMSAFHAQFEKIHPFSDGNGRTGRLLMLAQALSRGLMPPLVAKERKNAYYKYLELAQVDGKFEPLELFIAQSVNFTASILRESP